MKRIVIILLSVLITSGCTSASRAAWQDPQQWQAAAEIVSESEAYDDYSYEQQQMEYDIQELRAEMNRLKTQETGVYHF